MLELNVVMVILVLLSTGFYPMLNGFYKGYQKIIATIELHQAARYSFAFLERELLLNTGQVKLATDLLGKRRIICDEIFGNRQTTYYIQRNTLYREIKYGVTKGVNPLSLASVKVLSFDAEVVNQTQIRIILELEDKKTLRGHKFERTLNLSNGEQ